MTFFGGLLIGFFGGAIVGVLIMALCIAAKIDPYEVDDENKQ